MTNNGTLKICAIGEVMIEMAPLGGAQYQRGFAGDTFNTLWHMAQILGPRARAGYVTKVGTDALSDDFVEMLTTDGLDPTATGRDPERTMGLYLIALKDAERSFHYWRAQSAAKQLAADPAWLAQQVAGADLIHVSGITVAILSPDDRASLLQTLSQARRNGSLVSFDPNIRPALWASQDEIRTTLAEYLAETDIALPSFDDETTHWGDATPQATRRRFLEAGVTHVLVKNGSDPVVAHVNGKDLEISTPKATGIIDTSGAGDAFNAGFLSAFLSGAQAEDAIRSGQRVSAEVIRHLGARIPKEKIPSVL